MTRACQRRTVAASGQSDIVQPLNFRRESGKVTRQAALPLDFFFAQLLVPFSRSAVKIQAAVSELLGFDTKIFITIT